MIGTPRRFFEAATGCSKFYTTLCLQKAESCPIHMATLSPCLPDIAFLESQQSHPVLGPFCHKQQ
jgi:hypothetical protein